MCLLPKITKWWKMVKPVAFQCAVLMLMAPVPPTPADTAGSTATAAAERVLRLITVIGAIYLLWRSGIGRQSVADAEGGEAISRPLMKYAGFGLAVLFAYDLIGDQAFGKGLFDLLIGLLTGS